MAVGLLHEPEILFLDEATSGADTIARIEFWRRISRLAEQEITIIITTHFMEEAEYYDRIIDTRQMLRDKSTLTLGVVIPVMLLLLFGFELSVDVEKIPVAIVRENYNAVNIFDSLRGSGYFDISLRIWYNHAARSKCFLIPGVTVMIMTLTGTLLTALVIAREWERGTYEALIATDIEKGEIVAEKLYRILF